MDESGKKLSTSQSIGWNGFHVTTKAGQFRPRLKGTGERCFLSTVGYVLTHIYTRSAYWIISMCFDAQRFIIIKLIVR